MLVADCCVGSQTCGNFVTSLLGSTTSPKLEKYVLKVDNLYTSQTSRLNLGQPVSESGSLSQNQTACLKVGQCVSMVTGCLEMKTGWVKVNLCVGLCSSLLFGNAASLKPKQFVNLNKIYNPKDIVKARVPVLKLDGYTKTVALS